MHLLGPLQSHAEDNKIWRLNLGKLLRIRLHGVFTRGNIAVYIAVYAKCLHTGAYIAFTLRSYSVSTYFARRYGTSAGLLAFDDFRTPTNSPMSHLPARDFFRTLCKAFWTHFCRRRCAVCRLIRLPILDAVSLNCMHRLRAHQDQLVYKPATYVDAHITVPRAPDFSKFASWH